MATRVQQPKAVAASKAAASKAAPKAAAAKPDTTPVVADAAPPPKAASKPKTDELVEPTEEPAAAEAAPEKKSRIQIASVLGVSISQARCATHLKQNLGDEEIEGEIKKLRATLKREKEAGASEVDLAGIRADITETSKNIVRISSETPIASAVVWDGAVKELLRHGMDQAIAADRKIVDVANLVNQVPDDLLIYLPLYSKCPIWAEYDPLHEEELKKERAVLNKAAKAARDVKKAEDKTAKGGAKAGKGAKAPPVVDEEADDGEDADNTKTTFHTYVENALKAVKKVDPYKSMRVSGRVREFLSELVVQGIARHASLARIIVQRVVAVRTMNANHIKAVIHMLMADEGRTAEQINQVTGQIDEKLVVYHRHLSTEKVKKAAALDEGKKAENARKGREAELARKLKQAELAKKRALDASQKAEDLMVSAAALAPIVAAEKAEAADKAEAAEKAAEIEKAALVDVIAAQS